MHLLKLALIVVVLAILVPEGESWRRRRRRRCPVRSCQVSHWSVWSPCSQVCGHNGIQTRTRTKTVSEACGGSCRFAFSETRDCNRYCQNGGTPHSGYCYCKYGFTGKCCELRAARSCQVSHWSVWSPCSQVCGHNGIQTRTRTKTVSEAYGGSCRFAFSETRDCNRYCQNGGTPHSGYCYCKYGFTGKCCEHDRRHESQNSGNGQHGRSDKVQSPSSDLSAGDIVGIVLGVLAVTGGVAIGVYCCTKRYIQRVIVTGPNNRVHVVQTSINN